MPSRADDPRAVASRSPRAAPILLVLAASVLFRLPVLVNAAGVNSDAAVVGLQARHMMRGEWSPFLWGIDYQSSVDAAVAALAFALAGAKPLTLLVLPVLAHLLLTWLGYDLLRRHSTPWAAAMLVTPLVFSPMAVNFTLLYVSRAWSLTAVFAALWLLDGAVGSRQPLLRYAVGSALALVAVLLDLYTLLFLPGAAIFALGCALDGAPTGHERARRWAACAGGGALGLALLWSVRAGWGVSSSAAALTTARLAPNLGLLLDVCLPWTLGYKTFVPGGGNLSPALWAPPLALSWIPVAGLLAFAGLLTLGALAIASRGPGRWSEDRLGLLGLVVTACALAGFLLSPMPRDAWSSRYLAPIIYAAPFALAPASRLLTSPRFGLALLPYAVSAAVSGWLGWGDYVRGPWPALSARGAAEEELELGRELRRLGIHHAVAQYWLSYRLTFLFEEDPVVVPLEAAQDRYPPYRDRVAAAQVVAFLFHASEPRARPGPVEEELRRANLSYQRLDVEGFTVLVARRAGPR